MTYREKPTVNRYLEQKEQEYAYRKHAQALANARPTINTQAPVTSNRIIHMQKINAENRRRIIQQNEENMRLIKKARSGKKSATLARVETSEHSARRKKNIYDDIDLFAVDKTNYKSSTSRIRQYEDPIVDDSDSDDIPYPSDDDEDDDGVLFGGVKTGRLSDNYDYSIEHQGESIRIGYGDKLVESFTDSTSVISNSDHKKNKKGMKNQSIPKKTYESSSQSKNTKVTKKAPRVTSNIDETFLTNPSTDDSDGLHKKRATTLVPKERVVEKIEIKEEEAPTTALSLKKTITDILNKEDEKEEEFSDKFSDGFDEEIDEKPEIKEEKKPEKEESSIKEIEEDLFSTDSSDSSSESGFDHSPLKEKTENKSNDKEDSMDSNFESDDLDIPDF